MPLLPQRVRQHSTITTVAKTTPNKKRASGKVGITEVVLRDAHQSLLATRLRTEDMLPIAAKLDEVGYWSLESWGGATFDACIRYLGEDPWERIRAFKSAMPKTPQQMLLRGQNLLGYRHYADDVVRCFVERAAKNGVDVFRVFDAMNDTRNLITAVKAVLDTGKHAQGTICYTISPVHTVDSWVDMAKRLEDMGVHSIAIKDMAGLLTPYIAYDLVSRLKKELAVPIHMQSHATTGMSTTTIIKAIEAGIDNVDTAISSMSMTTGHSATESVVAITQDTPYDTGLDIDLLAEIAVYFREVRKRYAAFEGSLRGVDTRILQAQVPGGMLTNMENQLREQKASDRMDDVFVEIPKVRKDLGYLPMVTPTSQIVGTQAVMNVLAGERYKSISRETAGILKGEYGATPAPVDGKLQSRVLKQEKAQAITCRPADMLKPEMKTLEKKVQQMVKEKGVRLAKNSVEDVLIYALFPQVGWTFLCHRGQPEMFESPPQAGGDAPQPAAPTGAGRQDIASYSVRVDGQSFTVEVGPQGALGAAPAASGATSSAAQPAGMATPTASGESVNAPMAGVVHRLLVKEGQAIASGDVVLIMEAMKMETEVRCAHAGTVKQISVSEGDKIDVGDVLMTIG